MAENHTDFGDLIEDPFAEYLRRVALIPPRLAVTAPTGTPTKNLPVH